MRSKPVSLRIPEPMRAEIAAIAQQTQRSLAAVVREMLAEDLKMRRVRGIYFADEFERREAKVGGTGLGVWEVIETYKAVDEVWDEFKQYYDQWLSESQLCMALAYYQAFPDEIDEQIRENQSVTEEEIWAAHPFTRPGWSPDEKRASAG